MSKSIETNQRITSVINTRYKSEKCARAAAKEAGLSDFDISKGNQIIEYFVVTQPPSSALEMKQLAKTLTDTLQEVNQRMEKFREFDPENYSNIERDCSREIIEELHKKVYKLLEKVEADQ